MISWIRYACLVSTLALFLTGCALLPELPDAATLVQEAEELLPLAPIGGVPIELVAQVELENRETVDGAELVSSSGAWTHTVEGRLLDTMGWLPHGDEIEDAHGSGSIHCYHPAGPEHNWTVQWAGDIAFDDGDSSAHPPAIHVHTDGDDALVLYVPPTGFLYPHPGSRDDCQNPDPVPAHQARGDFWIPQESVERAPDADTSSHSHVQEGIVVLRVPLADLRSGVSETASLDLAGEHRPDSTSQYEWRLRVELTLTSSPGGRQASAFAGPERRESRSLL